MIVLGHVLSSWAASMKTTCLETRRGRLVDDRPSAGLLTMHIRLVHQDRIYVLAVQLICPVQKTLQGGGK